VETQEQLDYLVKHKCDKIQGYLFSKPIAGEAVLDTLIEQGWSL
jgi:EAL domain-containing protein (putative c-di-GMP-specific phosphodiesterase class I)